MISSQDPMPYEHDRPDWSACSPENPACQVRVIRYPDEPWHARCDYHEREAPQGSISFAREIPYQIHFGRALRSR